jgi:hypothetical protein
VCEEKNRLNGFSLVRSWFTALKRGVNEMISTAQHTFKKIWWQSIVRYEKLC